MTRRHSFYPKLGGPTRPADWWVRRRKVDGKALVGMTDRGTAPLVLEPALYEWSGPFASEEEAEKERLR